MIGGEAAERAVLARPRVAEDASARDPYGLGWVMDWLYGDAALPPMPLPPEPDILPFPRRRPAVPAYEHAAPAPVQPRKRRGHARQLVLL